jgi:hypothetical protein
LFQMQTSFLMTFILLLVLVVIKKRNVIGSVLGQQMYGGLFFLISTYWVIPRTIRLPNCELDKSA